MVDVFTSYEGNRLAAWGALQGPIIGALSLVIGIEVASRTVGFLMARALPKLEADMRMTMFDHVQHHSPKYFNEKFAGSLANKLTDMITQVSGVIQMLFWPVVPALAGCILGAIFLWLVNPIFGYLMIGWIVIHLGVCFKLARTCDVYEHKHGEPFHLGTGMGRGIKGATFGNMHHSVSRRGRASSLLGNRKIKSSSTRKALLSHPAPSNLIVLADRSGNCC